MLSAVCSHSSMRRSCLALPRPLLLFLVLLAASFLAPHAAAVTEQPVVRAQEATRRNMLENSLKPFYLINNKFLDIVQSRLPDSRVLLDLVNNTKNAGNASVTEYFHFVLPVIVAYPGYVALLCLGLVLLLVMPIVGACWCSCRCCCNRCGATAKPMDGRFARCKRGTFGVLLGVLSTLVLGGAVLSFISNDLLHRPFQANSHDNPVTVVNSSLGEIADSLDAILKNFNNQTLLMLGRQVPLVKAAVKNSSNSAMSQIMKASKIEEIITTADAINNSIQPYLTASEAVTKEKGMFLETYHNMTSEVATIADDLRKIFNSCVEVSCNNSRSQLDSLTFIPADKINLNISETTINVLLKFNSTEFSEVLKNAKASLANVSAKMTEMGATKVDDLLANLNDSKKIESYFKSVDDLIGNFTGQMRLLAGQLNNGTIMNKKWKPFLAEVDEYRMYGFIGLASTILLIVFFFYLGLCFGACGEPPYEDARMCNRGAGATLMSCGVGFTFFFFPIVIVVVTATFLVGAPLRTEVCRYLLKERPNTKAFDVVLSQTLNELNISVYPDLPFPPNFTYHVLGDCENNTSIVTALSLGKKISGSIIYDKEVQPNVAALRKKMKEIDLKISIRIIDTQTQQLIDMMVSEKLNNEITFINIEKDLNQPAIKNFDELNAALMDAGNATNSSAAVGDALNRMKVLKQNVEVIAGRIRVSLKNLHSMRRLKSDIGKFRTMILDFSQNVRVGSPMLIKQIDLAFDALERTVRGILVRSVDVVLSEYASCRTLNQQATRLVQLVCRNLLDPFNGFWLGIGWSLLILIPSMILACKLNYLYRKTEYYVKDYEETDYLTYQGFYPSDVIPLERGPSGMKLRGGARGEQYA